MDLDLLANEWLVEQYNQQTELGWKSFLTEMSKSFESANNHISDCFADTSYWVQGTQYSTNELETTIVYLCKLGMY